MCCGLACLQKSLRASLDGALLREQVMGAAPGTPLSPKNLDEQVRRSCFKSVPATAAKGLERMKAGMSMQAERDEDEIAEVEMILETYFMHIDNTFNKLQTLCEYIDDTEVRFCLLLLPAILGDAAGLCMRPSAGCTQDYINIELDNHRNQLIRVGAGCSSLHWAACMHVWSFPRQEW